MKRFRFSLASLVLLVAIVAVVFAATRLVWWPDMVVTIVLCALFGATVAMVSTRGVTRAFGAGCTFFGWGYVLVTGIDRYAGHLVTDHVLAACWEKLQATRARGSLPEVLNRYLLASEVDDFLWLGHSALTPFIALTGGLLCRYFYKWNRQRDVEQGAGNSEEGLRPL